MRLQTQERDVQVIGSVLDKRAAQIELNPVIFEILSGKIYSDKILAVVRELSCNAVDAHKAAGNTKAFDVQLPTNIEPSFRIRDYGTGLSHEDVFNLYMTFGASSKRSSDSFIGGFGIGSKAPLAYTNAFTVNSFFNGEQRSYSVFIDEDGKPATMHIYTQKTDEPNGLEISVPVKASDIFQFERTCLRFYKFFTDIKPNFLGKQIQINEPEYQNPSTVSELNYGFLKNPSYLQGQTAVVGNVAYPIDNNIVYNFIKQKEDLVTTEKSCLLHIMRNNFNVVYFFNVGDVDIAASREALSYTNKTFNTIINLLKNITQNLKKKITEEIEKAPNKWEASKVISHNFREIRDWLHLDVQYKNEHITSYLSLNSYFDKTKNSYIHPSYDVISINDLGSKKIRINYRDSWDITPYEIEQVVIEDTKNRRDARIRTFFEQNKLDDDASKKVLLIQKSKDSKEALDDFLKQIEGCPTPVYLSSVQPDAKYINQGKKIQRKTVSVQVFDIKTEKSYDDVTFDLSTLTSKHVVVVTAERKPNLKIDNAYYSFDFRTIIDLLKTAGYNKDKFFIVPTSRYSKKFDECKNIIKVEDYLTYSTTLDGLKKRLSFINKGLELQKENTKSDSDFINLKRLVESRALAQYNFNDLDKERINKYFQNTHKIQNLIDEAAQQERKSLAKFLFRPFNINGNNILPEHNGFTLKDYGVKEDLSFAESFFEKYPMLQYLSIGAYSYASDELKYQIKIYMELIDNSKK